MRMNVRKLARIGVAPSVIALSSLAGSVAPAFADLSGPAPYEIEAKEQYCADHTTSCVPERGRPNLANLRFALVEVFRITPVEGLAGKLGGPDGSLAAPQALIAKCAGAHSIDGRGNIHAITERVYAGPIDQGFDGGSVHGAVVLERGSEQARRSLGVVAVSASDPVSGDTATVTGVQVANNTADSLVSGGFHVTLNGPQYDEIVAGPDFNPTALPTRTGARATMTCFTGNPSVSTPDAPPPYFENEVNDAPDAS